MAWSGLSGLPYGMARLPAGPTSEFYEELGRRIAEIRRSRSMSQERLGEVSSVAASYVAHIETGGRRPTLDVLRRIAGALEVPLWRLITDDRFSHEELAWDAAARELGRKVRGLTYDDLRALSYLADRLHGTGAYAARAAERRIPRLSPPSKRSTRSKRR